MTPPVKLWLETEGRQKLERLDADIAATFLKTVAEQIRDDADPAKVVGIGILWVLSQITECNLDVEDSQFAALEE